MNNRKTDCYVGNVTMNVQGNRTLSKLTWLITSFHKMVLKVHANMSTMYMNYRETWQQSDKKTYRHIQRCPRDSSFPGPPEAVLLGQNPQSLSRGSLFGRAEDSLARGEKKHYRVNLFFFLFAIHVYPSFITLPSLFLLASVCQLVNCESNRCKC